MAGCNSPRGLVAGHFDRAHAPTTKGTEYARPPDALPCLVLVFVGLSPCTIGKYMPTPSAWPVYRIVRFYQNGRKPRTIKSGLTEAEAQSHCGKERTHGPGWFDGYDYMKGYRAKAEAAERGMYDPH